MVLRSHLSIKKSSDLTQLGIGSYGLTRLRCRASSTALTTSSSVVTHPLFSPAGRGWAGASLPARSPPGFGRHQQPGRGNLFQQFDEQQVIGDPVEIQPTERPQP